MTAPDIFKLTVVAFGHTSGPVRVRSGQDTKTADARPRRAAFADKARLMLPTAYLAAVRHRTASTARAREKGGDLDLRNARDDIFGHTVQSTRLLGSVRILEESPATSFLGLGAAGSAKRRSASRTSSRGATLCDGFAARR